MVSLQCESVCDSQDGPVIMKMPFKNLRITLIERDEDRNIPSFERPWDIAGKQKGVLRCESAHGPLERFLFATFLSKTGTERRKNFSSNGTWHEFLVSISKRILYHIHYKEIFRFDSCINWVCNYKIWKRRRRKITNERAYDRRNSASSSSRKN